MSSATKLADHMITTAEKWAHKIDELYRTRAGSRPLVGEDFETLKLFMLRAFTGVLDADELVRYREGIDE
jgi:hypothetical protein